MSSRLRNKFIFLGCLLVFLGLGVFIYRVWVIQKPFAVILFVSENFSPSTLAAARLVQGGGDFRLKMESLPRSALAAPRARDFALPDAAAAASAISTGQIVNRGALSVTPEGQTLEGLFDIARHQGRSTGLVSNTPLADPAASAFYAPGHDPKDRDAVTRQLLDTAGFDLLLGGGGSDLVPEEQGGSRRDGRDLLLEARQHGFDIVRTRAELDNTPGWRAPRIFGVFADGDLAFTEEASRFPSQPSLADLVRRAIELLQYNRRGYFLVVHAGLPGRAAELSRGESLLREIAALDEAVETARRYAGDKALIMVAGLVNTGGLTLNAFSFNPDRGIAVLGPGASGIPALSWSTGPGPQTSGNGGNSPLEVVASVSPRPQPVAEDVLVLAIGPGSEAVQGFIDLATLNAILAREL